MARSREFEPAEALNKAMHVFWQKGFAATSLDDLVQATGVSRYGFYSTFGDKQTLFVKALEHYAAIVISRILGPLEGPNAATAEIRAYFAALLAEAGQGRAGCLIGNTTMEAIAVDAAVTATITNHFARMRQAFLNALQHAVARGEIAAAINPEVHADYLVGIAMAYLVYIRTAMPEEALRRFMSVALAFLA